MDNSKKWLLDAVEELIEENQTLREENQDLNKALNYFQRGAEKEDLYMELEKLYTGINTLKREIKVSEILRSASESAYKDLVAKYITLVNEEDMIYDDQWY